MPHQIGAVLLAGVVEVPHQMIEVRIQLARIDRVAEGVDWLDGIVFVHTHDTCCGSTPCLLGK